MPDDNAVICAEDNGTGIHPDIENEDTHIGIKNVDERLAVMCGTLTVQDLASGGTQVTITIPRID